MSPSSTISVLLHTRMELCLSLGNGRLLSFLGQRVPPLAPVAMVDHVEQLSPLTWSDLTTKVLLNCTVMHL